MKAKIIFLLVFLTIFSILTTSCIPEELKGDKKVAITIDTSFGDDYTEEILKILDEQKVAATFFVVGSVVEQNKIYLKRLKNYGMSIENHSYSHIKYTDLSDSEILEDIEKTNNIIKETVGYTPKYMRPPFNVTNQRVDTVIKSANMQVVIGLDSYDWERRSLNDTISNVVDNVCPGSAIIFHSGNFDTPAAIQGIIKVLKQRGYKFVYLDELLKDKKEI